MPLAYSGLAWRRNSGDQGFENLPDGRHHPHFVPPADCFPNHCFLVFVRGLVTHAGAVEHRVENEEWLQSLDHQLPAIPCQNLRVGHEGEVWLVLHFPSAIAREQLGIIAACLGYPDPPVFQPDQMPPEFARGREEASISSNQLSFCAPAEAEPIADGSANAESAKGKAVYPAVYPGGKTPCRIVPLRAAFQSLANPDVCLPDRPSVPDRAASCRSMPLPL